jgi:hypothetical protein
MSKQVDDFPPQEQRSLLHVEWEWETKMEGQWRRRRFKLVLGPIIGLVILGLASGKIDWVLAMIKRLFYS